MHVVVVVAAVVGLPDALDAQAAVVQRVQAALLGFAGGCAWAVTGLMKRFCNFLTSGATLQELHVPDALISPIMERIGALASQIVNTPSAVAVGAD